MHKNMRGNRNFILNDLFEQRKKALEDRYKELYMEGLNPSVVLEKLSEESGLSKSHLYRTIEVKKCKHEANVMGRLR